MSNHFLPRTHPKRLLGNMYLNGGKLCMRQHPSWWDPGSLSTNRGFYLPTASTLTNVRLSRGITTRMSKSTLSASTGHHQMWAKQEQERQVSVTAGHVGRPAGLTPGLPVGVGHTLRPKTSRAASCWRSFTRFTCQLGMALPQSPPPPE